MGIAISYVGIFMYLISSAVAVEPLWQDTLAPLLTELVDEDSSVRARAARRLGSHEDPRAIEALIGALPDEDVHIRVEAVGSLHRLTGQFFGFVPYDPPEKRSKAIARWRDWWKSMERTFPEACDRKRYVGYEDDIDRLVRRLESEQDMAHAYFIEVFPRIGRDAVLPLSRTLTSDLSWVRFWGARALGMIRDKSAVPHLIRKLQSSPESMDVIALGWLGDPRAIKPITLLLQHHDDGVRFSACHVLGEFHDPIAAAPLTQVWRSDTSEKIRSEALVALARCGDRDSLHLMVQRLAKGWTGSKDEVIDVLGDLNAEMAQIVGRHTYKFSVWIPPNELEEKAKFLRTWWEENEQKLVWDSSTGHFRVPGKAVVD